MSALKTFVVNRLRPEQVALLRRLRSGLPDLMPGRRRQRPSESPAFTPAPALAPAGGAPTLNYGLTGEETRLGLLWPWNHEVCRVPRRLPSGAPWPRISIVTATYNQGQFLEETIRSVLLQGYPNLEYILIDADSTDNTRQILRRYRSELSVVVSEPDGGQSDALNKGFRHATGQILAWLNSDDLYFPDTLIRIATAFDSFAADMVVGGTALIRGFARAPHGIHHCVFPMNTVVELPLATLSDFDGEWQKGKFFYQPEVFWTRTLWERSGGRVKEQLRYAMDYELWLRFASHGARLVHIPNAVTLFRLHDAQKTKWRDGEEYPEHRAVGRRYAQLAAADASAAAGGSLASSAPDLADISATIPKSIFDRRPVVSYATKCGAFSVPADAVQDGAALTIRSGGVFGEERIRLAEALIASGTAVIVVGAGFGQATATFAKRTGEAGCVFAFEADEYVFDVLRSNLAANHCHNVRAFLATVFDGTRNQITFPRSEYLRFPSYSTQYVSSSTPAASVQEGIGLDEFGITTNVSLLYLHTLSSDLAVLAGARETIARNRMPIVLDFDEELHAETGYTRTDFLQLLESLSYRIAQTLDGCSYLLVPREGGVPQKGATAHAWLGNEAASVSPSPRITSAPFRHSLCKVLAHRDEIDQCTRYLKRNGFVSHHLVCKDWDLAHLIPEIGDGNVLDMGSSDSYILKNVCIKGTRGEKYGVDLQPPDVPLAEVNYHIADLTDTKLPTGHFTYVTCLSVLEHDVDFDRFAREVSRLLRPGGKLFITFDYWDPLLVAPIQLYGLAWQPLDRSRVERLVETLHMHGLEILGELDLTCCDPVIRWGYYSPHPDMQYTFAMAAFEKSGAAFEKSGAASEKSGAAFEKSGPRQ